MDLFCFSSSFVWLWRTGEMGPHRLMVGNATIPRAPAPSFTWEPVALHGHFCPNQNIIQMPNGFVIECCFFFYFFFFFFFSIRMCVVRGEIVGVGYRFIWCALSIRSDRFVWFVSVCRQFFQAFCQVIIALISRCFSCGAFLLVEFSDFCFVGNGAK